MAQRKVDISGAQSFLQFRRGEADRSNPRIRRVRSNCFQQLGQEHHLSHIGQRECDRPCQTRWIKARTFDDVLANGIQHLSHGIHD
jgi:hypothetical protein